MKSTRIYNFTIPAGGNFQINASGSFFRLITASNEIEVDGDTFGNIYPLQVGQGLRGQAFNNLNLVNKTGNSCIGSILISDGEFVDDRITGDVSVIDGGKTRTLLNSAFLMSTAAGAVAGQFSYLQLWNPAGSGKNVIVKTAILSSTTAGIIGIYGNNTMNASGGANGSKKIGGGSSTSQFNATNLVGLPTGTTTILMSLFVNASTPFVFTFSEPIVVMPGYGLNLATESQNVTLRGGFEFFEEAA